jgi:hypothetical protein
MEFKFRGVGVNSRTVIHKKNCPLKQKKIRPFAVGANTRGASGYVFGDLQMALYTNPAFLKTMRL